MDEILACQILQKTYYCLFYVSLESHIHFSIKQRKQNTWNAIIQENHLNIYINCNSKKYKYKQCSIISHLITHKNDILNSLLTIAAKTTLRWINPAAQMDFSANIFVKSQVLLIDYSSRWKQQKQTIPTHPSFPTIEGGSCPGEKTLTPLVHPNFQWPKSQPRAKSQPRGIWTFSFVAKV